MLSCFFQFCLSGLTFVVNVLQRGPYVYTEMRYKENIELHEDEDRAVYNQRSIFTFDANASDPLTEEDILTLPNVPLLSFGQITESIPGLSGSISMFNTAIPKMFVDNTKTPFVDVTVGDFLFGGITMDCTNLTNPGDIDKLLMCNSYSLVHPPSVIINDPNYETGINTFALLKYKNDTYDGLYEVKLGIDEPKLIGQVISWNGQQYRDNWGGDSCNKIQGTDSTIFRPSLDEEDAETMYIYNTDICRTVKLTYTEETSYKDIAGKRYQASLGFLTSVLENTDNYCYCPTSVQNLTTKGGCLHSGLLELSSCQGAPVLLSLPHFLDADPMYQGGVEGLQPNESIHRIHLDLETYTGSPLRGASRIQMNVHLKPIPGVGIMENLGSQILPIMWMDEGVELNDEFIDMLNNQLLNVLVVLDIVRWVLIGLGLATFFGTMGAYMVWGRK